MSQPGAAQVLRQPYVVPLGYAPSPAREADELTKTIKDVSIVAVLVVLCIVLIVVVSVYMIVRFLHGIVDEAGNIAPTVECAAWLEVRRLGYLSGRPPSLNPSTGKPYTDCEAAAAAVADAQTLSDGTCPSRTPPPAAALQSPYLYYMAAQQC